MSNPNRAGSFTTTISGRVCTAVPKTPPAQAAATNNVQQQQTAPEATVQAEPDTSTTSSTPEPEITTARAQAQAQAPQAQAQAPQAQAQAPQAQAQAPQAQAQVLAEAAEPEAAQTQEEPQAPELPAPPPPPRIGAAAVAPQAPDVQPEIQAGIERESTAAAEPALPSSPTTDSVQALQNPQESAAESSQTDNNLVPTNESVPQPTLAIPQDEPADAPVNVNGNLITTIGLAPGSAGESQATSGPEVSVVGGNGGRSGGGAPTAVVAGSVIGGLAVVSIVAFLLWFWRKRILKRRRSTLLTPLSVVPSLGRGNNNNRNNNNGDSNEKSYVIDRGSLGPTPKSQKFMASVGANVKRIRDQFSRGRDDTASVDMNRGNSQFFERDPIPQHSRNSSDASSRGGKGDVTSKDRFKDWWMRLTADVNFNWRLRSDRSKENDPFAATRDMKEKKAAMDTQPNFLTLVGMNGREVQREAERRRLHKPNKGSVGSDHFLHGLNLNFDSANDPFSDANALRHDSAKPAPLVVSQPNNPFSDANAIGGGARGAKQPATYVAEVRRSRGQSVGVDSVYRESVQSVESFGTRRNKFRSDPFDLDRPELLNNRQKVTSSNISTAGDSVAPRLSSNTSGSGGPHKPGRAHTRADSYSSKYSSGISMGDWSDPGPDVGPAATRWDSPTEGWRSGERKPGSRRSGSSQSSVGKAL